MDYSLFFRGLVIGFSIAATADALYGCVAGFGLTFISSLLIDQQMWLRLFGGLFLLYLGVKTLLSKPAEQAAKTAGKGLPGAYASTFLLTVTNPLTILSFAAIFAGLGLANTTGSYASALVLVLGVFLGSASWWLLLSGSVGLFRNRFNTQGMVWVNRISGVIITAFGMVALGGLI